jgi:hypothetical protein
LGKDRRDQSWERQQKERKVVEERIRIKEEQLKEKKRDRRWEKSKVVTLER